MKITMMPQQTKKYNFDAKWSPAIRAHGFTSMPNLLLVSRKKLGLSVPEIYILGIIETFRWDDRDPWPSLETISMRAGLTVRTVSRHLGSLVNKGYIRRKQRAGISCVTSIEGLIARLDDLATSVVPPGQKRPTGWDKTRHYPRTVLSTKEDAAKQTHLTNPNIKTTGFIKSSEVLNKVYGQKDEQPIISNDFDKE